MTDSTVHHHGPVYYGIHCWLVTTAIAGDSHEHKAQFLSGGLNSRSLSRKLEVVSSQSYAASFAIRDHTEVSTGKHAPP